MIHSQFSVLSLLILPVAAAYLLVYGIFSLIVPLFHLGPNHIEFQARSKAYRIGAHARELTFSAAYLVAGVSLFWHQAWGRTFALVLLVIVTIYAPNAFAWGFSSGPPTPRVRLFSWVALVAWNGIWFYVIYRLAS